jgi:hypothetical protein
MKVILFYCVVAVLVLAGASVHALESFVLYDDFTATSINPLKWTGLELVGRGTEANRRIDVGLGGLRLAYRAFGNTTSNSGQITSEFGLLLSKNPSAIKSLQAQVKVLAVQVTDCTSNSGTTLSRAGLRGAFFSAGTSFLGGAVNDVHALLFLRRVPTDLPHVLRVTAQMFRCTNQLCSQFDSLKQVDVAPPVTVGQMVELQIEWDAATNRFFFQSGINPKVAISYVLPDLVAPTIAFKALEVAEDVENCTTTPRPAGFMDAVFDNVQVIQSANP